MTRREPKRVLVEGRPGVGKTTVARALARLLQDHGVAVGGFTTEEIREGRRRVGFAVESVDGKRAILAHVDLPGPPRVGKYGVDLEAFEGIALPTLDTAALNVVVIDELGKMELASARFRDAVSALIAGQASVVATVHAYRHPFTDELKRRRDAVLFRVTAANRDALPSHIADLVEPAPKAR